MDGIDIGTLLNAPPATLLIIVAYFLGRDGLKTYRRWRSDEAQKIKYGNGSVKDSVAWRGQTDERLTQLETKFDAWGKRFDAEMAAAKATRNEMFKQLKELQKDVSWMKGRMDAREGKWWKL